MDQYWSKLRRGAELVAAVLFAVMFGTFVLQVFMRYVFNQPLKWSLEFDLIIYVWIVFWGAAFLVRPNGHISFNLIYDHVSPAVRRVLAIAGALTIAGAFVVALPATFDFVTFMAIESTPVIRWRFDFVFSVFLIFAVALIVRLALQVVRLLQPNWRDHL